MKHFDLLTAVQPDEGWFAVVGIKEGSAPRQTLVATREEVEEVTEALLAQNRNVFYGVAKFETDESRKKENVKALKCFWLDIDCGEGKPYSTQQEGFTALRDFCRHIGLPKPILVDSGRGLHVYWPLTEAITRHEWEPVAARLQSLCNTHELHTDPQCFEVARVLRIPGTYNFKGDTPLEVTVVSEGAPPMPFSEFKQLLGIVHEEASSLFGTAPRYGKSHLQQRMEENNEYSFEKILRRSLAGDGCNQIRSYYENRDSADYDQWFKVLTVANVCRDRETAIHTVSEGHPEYDPAATEDKARGLTSATSCTKFEDGNPAGCEGCQFKGKIGSPKRIGLEIPEATEEEGTVTVEIGGAVETYTVPPYPYPFFRGKTGGVYCNPPPGAEEAEPILVFEDDIYVVKRMRDVELGDVTVLRLHTPMDGVREIIVPMAKMTDPVELRKVLSSESVIATKKNYDLLMQYLQLSVKELRAKKRVEQMRLQFGWADNDSKFIVGDTEITKDGNFHSPPSSTTRGIARFIGPVGNLNDWKEVFNLYGRPGLEAHAFGALTAFGSPLLRFLGQSGALINLIHPNSGTGKTTILRMCNSVWGHPERLCATKDDTLNAKIMRLGIHNNLPVTVDEMTNSKPEEISTFTYCVSQGRGKDRMKASENELRHNAASWQTIALCSSNASFYEKLALMKQKPDGEMMRLMEYKIGYTDAIDPTEAKHMFDHQLANNYGHAGPLYARWLLENLEEAKDTALSIQAKLDRELNLMPRERFWSALVAANLAGGLISKHKVDLHDWNMKSIYSWAAEEILSMRNDVKAPVGDTMQVIGDYINRHMQNILIVDDGADRRTKSEVFPVREPKGELLIRYEPDTKRMFLVVKAFKDDCAKYQISSKDTIEWLKQKGILIATGNKRITKGMGVSVPGVQCHVLDCSNPDFITLDDLVETHGGTDAGGER